MKISVKGVATKYYEPDKILVKLVFKALGKTNKIAIDKVQKNICYFQKNVLDLLAIEDLKTISSNTNVNNAKLFECVKIVCIEFEYSQKLLLKFEKLISLLKNQPSYSYIYRLDETDKYKKEVMIEACKDAKNKVLAISEAYNLKLKKLKKVSSCHKFNVSTSNINGVCISEQVLCVFKVK